MIPQLENSIPSNIASPTKLLKILYDITFRVDEQSIYEI
jgi:hypothetical protein